MAFLGSSQRSRHFQFDSIRSKRKDVLYYGLMTAGSFAVTTYLVKNNFTRKWVSLSLFFGLHGLRNTISTFWSCKYPPKQEFTPRPLVADPKDLFPKLDPNAEVPIILKCIKEALRIHGPNESPPLCPSTPPCTKMGSFFKDFVEDLNEIADMKRFNCTNYNTTKQEYLKMFVEIQRIITEAKSRRSIAKQCLKESDDSISKFLNFEWIRVVLVRHMTEIDLLNFSYAETAEERKQFPDKTTVQSISYERIEKAYRILIQGECLSNCGHNAKKLRDELRAHEADKF